MHYFFQMAAGYMMSLDDWVPHVRDPSPDNGSKLGEAELSRGLYCDNCDNTKAHSISC